MDDWVGVNLSPSDDAIISCHLRCKLTGRMLPINEFIKEIDIYKVDPLELPFLSNIKPRDPVWFFFVRNHGGRQNRTTSSGFWKITGNRVPVKSRWGDQSVAIGFKKHLRFHDGRTPNEGKGEWFIEEFHNTMLPQNLRTHVMCKVKYTGMNKNVIFDNATEFSPVFVSHLTNTVLNQPVRGHGGSVNNLSEYDSVNQVNQSFQRNFGFSGHLSEYDPANHIQHLGGNFNTQEQAPYFASNQVDQSVQRNREPSNNLPVYNSANQVNQLVQGNWGSSGHLSEHDPANQIQDLGGNFKTQEQAPFFASNDNERQMLWNYNIGDILDEGQINSYTYMRDDYNEYQPKNPVTKVFDDYSSDSDNESMFFGDTWSSADSVGNPNELCSTPIPPLNSIQAKEVKMELQDKEKVKNEWVMKIAEDSCINKTPTMNIEKKTHRTPKWIYLRNKESWVVAVLLLFCVIGWTILYFVNWSLILD